MIIKIGDIFESSAQTLVNTVNCVGVMGKGVALTFKNKYPAMFREYVRMCNNGEVRPGVPYYYSDLYGASVLNFPTKDHWRSPSKLSYISDGLDWFREHYQALGITSIAFPPLGCGNGGLSWSVVGPVMYDKLKDIPINVEIYAPFGTKSEELTEAYLKQNLVRSSNDFIGNKNIPFNKYWYFILYAIQCLNNDRYSLSVGRTIFQKVCYILTRTGLPTGFTFVEGSYGPYSKEAKDSVTALSNANLMMERQCGKMIETIVSPTFQLPRELFTKDEIAKADQAIDLLSRMKSTEHTEMVATVLFSYDELKKANRIPSDFDVFEHVFSWKPRWKGHKEMEVRNTIFSLSMLGYMTPSFSGMLIDVVEEM